MKIILLLNQSYPYGYALTKRFHLYAKGFIQEGHQTEIIIPHPTEKSGDTTNTATFGNYEKVPFRYMTNSTARSKKFFKRRVQDFTGALKTGFLLNKEKPEVVISATFSIWFFVYIRLISILTGTKIYRERNEVDSFRKDKVSKFKHLKNALAKGLFHGSVVITHQLKNYIEKELKIKKPNIVVPILIEAIDPEISTSVLKTVVYTGTYRERKDGILTVLKAFARIMEKYPGYKLILTGMPERSKDFKKIMTLISAKKLESRIKFTGYLSEKELWEVLTSAGMLMNTKPDNRQNHYNFPTKMGEYLISGRPVLSTRVGVIGEIMKDLNNIVFTEYGVKSISDKMEFIINNPELAAEIGKNGREYALNHFDYKMHTRRMIEFFQNFNR